MFGFASSLSFFPRLESHWSAEPCPVSLSLSSGGGGERRSGEENAQIPESKSSFLYFCLHCPPEQIPVFILLSLEDVSAL